MERYGCPHYERVLVDWSLSEEGLEDNETSCWTCAHSTMDETGEGLGTNHRLCPRSQETADAILRRWYPHAITVAEEVPA